ncbi:hypothetical protein V6N13_036763 [Hibiscus sabdariffa]
MVQESTMTQSSAGETLVLNSIHNECIVSQVHREIYANVLQLGSGKGTSDDVVGLVDRGIVEAPRILDFVECEGNMCACPAWFNWKNLKRRGKIVTKLRKLCDFLKKWNKEFFGHVDTSIREKKLEIDRMDSRCNNAQSESQEGRYKPLNFDLWKLKKFPQGWRNEIEWLQINGKWINQVDEIKHHFSMAFYKHFAKVPVVVDEAYNILHSVVFHHIFREANSLADALAKNGVGRTSWFQVIH